MATSAALVLATVNAPHSTQLKAHELAHCLQDQAAAMAVPAHMSCFFGEVDPALQVGFASLFGISEPQVTDAAKGFRIVFWRILSARRVSAPNDADWARLFRIACSVCAFPDLTGNRHRTNLIDAIAAKYQTHQLNRSGPNVLRFSNGHTPGLDLCSLVVTRSVQTSIPFRAIFEAA